MSRLFLLALLVSFAAIAGTPAASKSSARARQTKGPPSVQAIEEAQTDNEVAAQLAAIAAESQVRMLMITTIGGFVTLALGFAGKLIQDNVNYRRTAEATAAHRDKELSKIDEVGVQAKAAYIESNTVNQKIASIGLEVKDGSRLNPEDKGTEKS